MAISTDVIVGFPTETDTEFNDTMEVMKNVGFDQAYMFKYSERKGTTASRRFPDDVPESVKSSRITQLVEQQKSIVHKINKKRIGDEQEVLIEKDGTKKDENVMFARNEHNTIIKFPKVANLAVGDYTTVKIESASPHGLSGTCLNT